MTPFIIEFAQTPTANNRNILITVVQLRDFLVRRHNKVELSPLYLSKMGLSGHVVFKVYRDVEGAREIYYEYRGYSAPHMSPQLDSMVDQELPEKYV